MILHLKPIHTIQITENKANNPNHRKQNKHSNTLDKISK